MSRAPNPSNPPSSSRSALIRRATLQLPLAMTRDQPPASSDFASATNSVSTSPVKTFAAMPPMPKALRTTKTSQKLVLLPSEPQTRPLEPVLEHEAEPDRRTDEERMTKDEREQNRSKRLTAYCVAESFRMNLLAAFLKREHGVTPRSFDEALYVVYTLPLLPGYAQSVNIRSSLPQKTPEGKSLLSKMTEAEESGYQGTYFGGEESSTYHDGFFPSSSPPKSRRVFAARQRAQERLAIEPESAVEEDVADVVFFQYGVVVFYGLDEDQERAILEDMDNAGVWVRPRDEDDWEIEACHYVHDPAVAYPRIYNDFFTLKSRSHLLKLSISHALAQSTLLAAYESTAQQVLLHPSTMSIPRRLALTGSLKLRRGEAMKLTGRLFKLRRDVNLVSNVLDTPELFWSEASLVELYNAVRDYFEIGQRVQVLNEKLKVASDLLDIIHEHLNSGAMERITWIIIWLIVVACLVEFAEVLARLIVDSRKSESAVPAVPHLEPWKLLKRVITPSPVRLLARAIHRSLD